MSLRTSLRKNPLKNILPGILLAGAPVALAFLPGGQAAVSAPDTPTPADYTKDVKPMVDKYCTPCHGPQTAHGGINFDKFDGPLSYQKSLDALQRVHRQIRERSMPPRSSDQPTQAEREIMDAFFARTLQHIPDSVLPRNPGRVMIHRLSRLEYNNTVRDLFGVDTKPADKFPADGSGGGGFDNNADTLFIPPILMERYLSAAEEILKAADPKRLFLITPKKPAENRKVARQVLDKHAYRAFRRPIEKAESDRLLGLYDRAVKSGKGHEDAIRYGLKAVLVSPSFLFRIEEDKLPEKGGGSAARLSDYELASRLSYFLWASQPDDTLLELARKEQLRKPEVLEAQVARMMKSPKSRSFAESFASQWLRVRTLYTTVEPNPGAFRAWTPTLRDAAYQETIETVNSVLQNNENLLNLIDSDYTFLNEELAKHYGIEGVIGKEMRRVKLADRHRGGVITNASVLTLTSYNLRTSPVLRGKWVLEEMLGTPAPPPPPSVPTLSQDDKPSKEGQTFRQRLEAHRDKPECFSCHSRMDPIGFGLENFDAIGRWRDKIGEVPVDSSGKMTSGESFSGPAELKKILLNRKGDYARNVTEKMLSYALGRGIETYDLPAVRKITAALEKNDYRSGTLISEIVRSYPFQYRTNYNGVTPPAKPGNKTASSGVKEASIRRKGTGKGTGN